MTFYSKLISELGRGPLATNKLPRSTSYDLLLIDTSDSSSGLLLITIGFLLMVSFVKDKKFRSRHVLSYLSLHNLLFLFLPKFLC